jgi:hypothetical protein
MYAFRKITAGNIRRVGYNLADHVGGGGATNIGGGAQLPMSMPTLSTDHVIESNLPICDQPLEDVVTLDDAAYARIRRRITISKEKPATSVSAFNSSI